MPTTPYEPKFTADEAQRFAALVAGLDLGNANEAEAAGKFRALRRMVANKNIRLVDALELPEIRKALDDQMQPDRKEGPDLQAAKEYAAALREELTARTRDVRTLAEEVTELKELLLRRQREFDNFRRRGGTGNAGAAPPARAPVMGIGGLGVVAFILLMAWVAGAFHALHHSEPAQVAHTVRPIDTRETRPVPPLTDEEKRRGLQGLSLVECPEGVPCRRRQRCGAVRRP
jgi:hypothetical protein